MTTDLTARTQPAEPDATRDDSLTRRITEILTEHMGWLANNGFGSYCRCDQDFESLREHRIHVAALIAAAAQEHYRPVIETVEQLDALPDGSVYVSDSHQETPETKVQGCWYAPLLAKPFEPDLPGTVVWSPGADE